jgi:hypothetical protein
MTDVEVLVDLIQALTARLRRRVAPLSAAELAWQPDNEGNNIGVTVWHFSRWLDVLAVRLLQDRPAEEELWFARGWAARTGYDPRGIGYRGYGVLTGYTLAEVAALPALSAVDLLAYHDQASEAIQAQLQALPAGALHQPAPGDETGETAYALVKDILLGSHRHLGEIDALHAMQARQTAAAGAA